MNIKTIASIMVGIILLNNSLYTIIPLPGIISIAAIVAAAILLFMDSIKGGILGKVCLVFGIIIGIYALVLVLSMIGMSLPFISFIFSIQKFAFILGGILLIISPFVNF